MDAAAPAGMMGVGAFGRFPYPMSFHEGGNPCDIGCVRVGVVWILAFAGITRFGGYATVGFAAADRQ